MKAVVCGAVLWASLALWSAAHADDDPLPNFNAPVDRSPLNVDKVNHILGIPLFKAPSLWAEDSGFVAERLGWPQESRTSTESSHRLYPPTDKPLMILGAQAYSCVLYAEKARPTEVSIVFVNQGDYDWTQQFVDEYNRRHPQDKPLAVESPVPNPALLTPANQSDDPARVLDNLNLSDDDRADIDKAVHDKFDKEVKQDAQGIEDKFTALLGEAQHESFGGGSETRERVRRWDWQGHSFLLSSPKDTYVTLRIVPVSVADNNGNSVGISRDDLKTELLKRVKRLPSGDVVVSDIPMVDQGPKGYCVPATWERYLRFLGIPADMYVLAMAGGTSADGTDLDAMTANVDSLVTLYHRRIDSNSGDLDMKMIANNIDAGLPLMWACSIHVPLEKAISRRMHDRSAVTDWPAWGAHLATQDKTEIPAEITGSPSAGGHQRMIIGYNAATNEIAISDSWSSYFAIRWLTMPEANAINAGETYVISP